ncbi:ethanolamine utilization protein EutH [Shouchella miscanthi]|uniref:ethanolamine utilization protein EutH n=1 Tax=Shouchella miscanthi TaxID=2598861 RepID=UPI00119E69E3|nr:ethanolamine utilization protein EutH [Shouchella miscanthi]
MTINEWIMIILAFFIALGAIDWCLGNRFGLGTEFQHGIMSMGQVALAMIGIITIAPIAAQWLTPLITPLYLAVGADPASFANTILALDMGGYALAQEMGINADAARFSWVFLGTMLGPTIVFTIPIALRMVESNDQPALAKGMLIGLSTVPLGCFIGGLSAGMAPWMMLQNLLIPTVFACIVMFALRFYPETSITLFLLFGKGIQIVGVLGLAIAAISHLTGYEFHSKLAPFEEGLFIVGTIAVVLAGAFPLVAFLKQVCQPLFARVGKQFAIEGAAITAIITSLAHAIPAFSLLKDMSVRSKVVATSFMVSGAFVLGGHLGFTASVDQSMVVPMMIGKLIGGGSAVFIALMVERNDTL